MARTRLVAALIVVATVLPVVGASPAAGAPNEGELFTLGFRGTSREFVILATEGAAIRELRRDLAKPRSERRIVSGTVRSGKPYNPAWSYRMGSGSIILGEVFVEVCDASPTYVENHREDWIGERWCPWSSYVKRAGR